MFQLVLGTTLMTTIFHQIMIPAQTHKPNKT